MGETKPDENPIADFAAALNPAQGALAESLPFALVAETPGDTMPAARQPDLFSADEDTPCE